MTKRLRTGSLHVDFDRETHRASQVETLSTRSLAEGVGLTGGSVGLFYYDIMSSYPESMLRQFASKKARRK